MRPLLAGLFAALALPAAALEAPRDYAGRWTLSGVSEGDEVCTLTLTDQGAIGGWGIAIPRDCFDRLGLSEDIAAWTLTPGGAISFIDPLRKEKLRFEPTAIGGYVAEPDAGPPLALDRAGQGDVELTDQQRMTGRWTFTGLGGAPTCTVVLTAAPDGLSGALRRTDACRPPWSGIAITRWRRYDDRIIFLDRLSQRVAALSGNPVEGFSGNARGALVGFSRQPDGQ
ncbi:MAG: AprI/Inh family metalloprotease inhibitor [Caulobacter sp.]|nr:AprI/Inh family metalloprotease inhibitor [Caulobacter sp.]